MGGVFFSHSFEQEKTLGEGRGEGLPFFRTGKDWGWGEGVEEEALPRFVASKTGSRESLQSGRHSIGHCTCKTHEEPGLRQDVT